MKKICVLAPEQHKPYIEGIQKSAFETIRALEAKGHKAVIFSQKSYGESEQGVHYVFSTHKNKILKYAQWLQSSSSVANNIQAEHADAVFVFSLDWSFIPTLLRLLSRKVPTTVFVFSLRELTGLGGFYIRRAKNNPYITFWCFSGFIKDQLKSLGVSEGQIKGTPVFFTKPGTPPLGRIVNQGKYTIGYMSSAEIDAGINTMIRLAKAIPEVKVTLAVRSFRDTNDNLGIAHTIPTNVTIIRNLPNVPEFLATMDAIVLPPKNEKATMAIPLVALEAYYAGCAVFTSSLPVLKELQDRGIAQLFKDEDELIRIIRERPRNSDQEKKSLETFLSVDEFINKIIY